MYVHEHIIQNGWGSYVFAANCLADMYAKCGNMEDTWKMFNNMASHDMVSWNAYLEDVACMGKVRKLLKKLNRCVKKVYNQMIPFFWSFVLYPCRFGG
jgi:pentatricopeptide repeat protein